MRKYHTGYYNAFLSRVYLVGGPFNERLPYTGLSVNSDLKYCGNILGWDKDSVAQLYFDDKVFMESPLDKIIQNFSVIQEVVEGEAKRFASDTVIISNAPGAVIGIEPVHKRLSVMISGKLLARAASIA